MQVLLQSVHLNLSKGAKNRLSTSSIRTKQYDNPFAKIKVQSTLVNVSLSSGFIGDPIVKNHDVFPIGVGNDSSQSYY